MLEASPSAYPSGMLTVGQSDARKRSSPPAILPQPTPLFLGPCLACAPHVCRPPAPRTEPSCCTALCQRLLTPFARLWRRLGRNGGWLLQAGSPGLGAL